MESMTVDTLRKAIEKMTEYESKPKWLIYPKKIVDIVGGVDKCIGKIYELFGINMKFKEEVAGQYVFEEVKQS